jgi:hypothetical protein
LYQDRIMHLCTGIVLKKLLWNKWDTCNIVLTSYLLFVS